MAKQAFVFGRVAKNTSPRTFDDRGVPKVLGQRLIECGKGSCPTEECQGQYVQIVGAAQSYCAEAALVLLEAIC